MTLATTVRERGILFTGPNVRAILENRKTQTRRTAGLEVVNESPDDWTFDRWQRYPDGSLRAVFDHIPTGEPNAIGLRCPYGEAGDLLWGREAWAWCPKCGGHYLYRADGDSFETCHPTHPVTGVIEYRWRPSIHMPRKASRLPLQNTDVRVERLNDITEADIIAEGMTVDAVAQRTGTPWSDMPTLHHAWRVGWDHINAQRGYGTERNPWVWPITFVRKDVPDAA